MVACGRRRGHEIGASLPGGAVSLPGKARQMSDDGGAGKRKVRTGLPAASV